MKLIVSDEREIIYRKPPAERVCSSAMALLFVTGLIWVMPAMHVFNKQAWQDMAPVEIIGRGSVIAYLLLLLLAPLLLWYMAGPEELMVDLLTRSYRFRRGFPLLAQWQTGPIDDIRCLYTKPSKRQSSSKFYHALLAWKSDANRSPFLIGDGGVAHRRDVLLGIAKTPDAAMQLIAPIAAALHVPAEDGALPENYARNRRYQRRQKRIIMRLTLTIMMFIMLLLTAPDAIVGQMLQARGRPATGTVIARQRGKQNLIKVEYQANGKTYQIKDKVADVVFQQTPTGTHVPLLYLPDYPHTARTTVSNAAFYGRSMLGLWLALALFALIAPFLAAKLERKPGFDSSTSAA